MHHLPSLEIKAISQSTHLHCIIGLFLSYSIHTQFTILSSTLCTHPVPFPLSFFLPPAQDSGSEGKDLSVFFNLLLVWENSNGTFVCQDDREKGGKGA